MKWPIRSVVKKPNRTCHQGRTRRQTITSGTTDAVNAVCHSQSGKRRTLWINTSQPPDIIHPLDDGLAPHLGLLAASITDQAPPPCLTGSDILLLMKAHHSRDSRTSQAKYWSAANLSEGSGANPAYRVSRCGPRTVSRKLAVSLITTRV